MTDDYFFIILEYSYRGGLLVTWRYLRRKQPMHAWDGNGGAPPIACLPWINSSVNVTLSFLKHTVSRYDLPSRNNSTLHFNCNPCVWFTRSFLTGRTDFYPPLALPAAINRSCVFGSLPLCPLSSTLGKYYNIYFIQTVICMFFSLLSSSAVLFLLSINWACPWERMGNVSCLLLPKIDVDQALQEVRVLST